MADAPIFDAVDPFTLVYRAVLSALKADAPLLAMAGTAGDPDSLGGTLTNLPDLSDPNVERARSLSPGDPPGLLLIDGPFVLDPFGGNSKSAGFEQSLTLQFNDPSASIGTINVLKWRTTVALFNAGPDLGLTGLVRSYVVRRVADDVRKSLGQVHESASLEIVVQGVVSNADLR